MLNPNRRPAPSAPPPPPPPRNRARKTTLRIAALALLLAATTLAGGLLAGPTPPASAGTLAVSAVAIQSSAGADTQYHAGDDITIRVTFGTETITAHTGATITIDVGGVNRTATAADVASGGTNAYVDFTYTVTDADSDTDGITVAAGTLGGSYTHTDPHTSVAFTQTVSASTSHRVNVDVTNYDSDGDGLIEIENLDQLNAIRYDLDGNGQPAAANISNYAAAFPGRSQSHGCPDRNSDNNPGPCAGYELNADLDFDTDGSGSVGAGDDYPNWVPIATGTSSYTAAFNGNGHTISNMTINISGVSQAGLFGSTSGGTLENVGLLDVSITARDSGAQFLSVGGLAGYRRGAVRASYATGTINTTVGSVPTVTSAGGLVGYLGFTTNTSQVDASWAAVNINATSTSTATGAANADAVGGLVGRMVSQSGTAVTVTASWARGTAASSRTGSGIGGLVGLSSGSGATVSASYWDTVTSSLSSSAGGTGQTTTALQTPTGYTGIYSAWNINLDGQAGGDDPWNFGTSSQYPVLKYGGHNLIAQGRDLTVDYDVDDDGLIDISNLAQLNAIRYDLDGNGAPTDVNAYNSAFPDRDASPAGRMGCQLTDHDNMMATPDRATCTGYELLNDLDFDTDGDGATYTTSAMGVVAVDADDTNNYFSGAAGWTPLGGHGADAVPYTATFEGNHYTISNLFINLSTTTATASTLVGLFGDIGKPAGTSPVTPAEPGAVRNVGLVNPYVSNTRTGSATPFTTARTGALAGRNSAAGAVSGSWVAGGSVAGSQTAGANQVFNFAGCLLGQNNGTVTASNASCNATATGADDANDYAGGLLGWNQGAVTGSYATGTATADSRAGGLAAELTVGGTVIASYATGAVSVTGDGGVAGGLVGSMSSASTAVRASYATGAVSTSGAGTSMAPNKLGGLAGQISGTAPVIVASYSIGTVTGGTGTNSRGGLVGALVSSATASQVTNSYWDETTTGIAGTGTGVRKTTAELRTPTAYGTMSTDIYMSWNLNLDGQTGNDDPWHFGTNAQYPLLKYGHDAASVAGQIARQAGADPVDYDADNDNLIEISALAQLDAIRYDLDGNGLGVVGDDAVAYAAAFPGLPKGMGCAAVCQGYELIADLDFDTDGDGQTYTISGGTVTADADDTNNFFNGNAGWTSIGDDTAGYSGVFEGNRHTIDHLFIHVSVDSTATRARVGLFSRLDGDGVIRGVGLPNAYVRRQTSSGGRYAGALAGQSYGTIRASSATGEVVVADTAGSGSSRAGGLVGAIGTGGAISASYADVTVRMTSNNGKAGGLAGYSYGGKIAASHAMGDVIVVNSPGALVGGLVGEISDNTNRTPDVLATIDASYARGAISGNSGTFAGRVLAGLVAGSSATARVTNSYWDTSVTSDASASAGGGTGQTTTQLQTPTAYGSATTTPPSIYANWNVDVDGDGANDDPWHFGANDQYPTLKYGGFSPAAQGSAGTDYDTDSDGLIEITTLAQLDAIRLDLDGDGRPTAVLAYRAAFPLGDVGSDPEMGDAGRMGCSHSAPVVRTCLGYELMADLDFDTDGDGSTHTAGVGDPGDDYYNAGAGWAPIGGHGETTHQAFTAVFDGNDNDIENLYLNLETSAADAGTYVGLFADLTGTVRNVGLAQPYVKNARSGTAAFARTGALAGRNSAGGVVRDSSVTGGSVTGDQSAVTGAPTNLVGCLLGYNAGTVRDSSASCAATATGSDDTRDQAGGLVGENAAITVNSVTGAGLIANSHATGNVTSDRNAGGLVGVSTTSGRVTGSYAEGDVTATGANGRAGGLLGLISAGTVVSDSYAIGDVRVRGSNAIAGGLVGKAQNGDTTVTRSYSTGDVTASGAGVRNLPDQLGNLLGGLAGELTTGAQITASYATGDVTATAAADNSILGGLVGHMAEADTLVLAAYATGSVTANGGGTNNVGGLLGELDDIENNIDSSYATGAVSATGTGAGVVNSEGGLVGALISPALASQVANSYYDNTADGAGLMVSPGGGSGQTTAALQSPVGYTGIYSAWNRDLDNADTDDNLATGGDDPWHFGGSSQYPVLQHSRGPLDIARQLTPVPTPDDYDLDNDNLIDVVNLAQLNAIRHDLNGDGAGLTGAGAAGYLSAYPGYTTGMGCPGTCNGYELRANLDFDTNGDGMVNASDEIADFRTIGGQYSATFQGNGHTISNMQITNNELGHKGLFGELSPNGKIYAVGLIEPVLSNGGGANGRFGALVGYNLGTIYASYVRGGAVSTNQDDTILGGLVGKNGSSVSGQNEYGKIYASYSTATVASAGHEFIDSGGLVGNNLRGTIVASYAAGAVTGSGANSEYGCLTGVASSSGIPPVSSVITSSYYEGTGEGRVCTRGGAGASKSNMELLEEAGYDGIYATWNMDLDNADSDNDLATGGDDPWDFRVGHYPALKYGSNADVAAQRPLLAEAGAAVEAYSGQTVTLDGSGSRAPSGATYRWTRMPTEAEPMVTITGDTTATPTFLAPTGLTSDTTMTFRLTLTADGRSVYDEVTVSIVAVRPNQLLSLSLTDSEGDAVGLAPPFVSLRYDYGASVANQIASVTVTPSLLEGSTMTLNGQAATSGAAVEIPLKYRGNQITIIVTPPEPEPSETTNGGDGTDGETTDGETVEETPCSVENNGVKPCTYTVTVNRAVPPRLAFVPRSLTIEEGGAGTYTVALDTRILTGAVTIAIASDNPDVTVSPTEVTLRPLDMAPRTITVTAASDADRNDETAVITHTANGAHYYDVVATVGVTVNDTTAPPPAPDPALSVSATALRLAEGGSGAYTVALATRPGGNVTVTIASDNPDVTTRPAALTFTPSNWSTAQRVTASAASDGDTANDTATLTHTASGGGYGDAPAVSVAVSVTDNDTAGLAITPTVLNLIENGISAYIVSLTAQPSGNVTVAIASDNPDVTVRPTALTFTTVNWATPQAVLVITRADDGGGDELATLRMTARGGGYGGQTGQVLASVDDTLAPLAVNADAPAGVSVYGPPGTTARATVSAAGADTPTTATGAGFGIGPAVAVSVSDAPDDGLEICLPVSDELRTEAGSALVLTLLRYAAGSWTELSGARDLGDRVCAAGVTGEAAYAAAYALRPGTVLDLAASVGADPGTIALSWTPPAAGTSQVAVVVNVADDTDYCLDTLPGIEASSYTCAGRTTGQTYVALLIVLLPDGGYTLANIVRFELPAAGGQ